MCVCVKEAGEKGKVEAGRASGENREVEHKFKEEEWTLHEQCIHNSSSI